MARNRARKIMSSDLAQHILLILHKEGAQTLLQLQEKTALQTSGLHNQTRERRVRSKTLSVAVTCDEMVRKKWIKLTDNATYELTAEGRVQAEEIADDMESVVHRIETQMLSPSAAARNATAGYFVLAILKMLAGLFSGSIGLIADGADTTVDTASSAIVWAGIKLKKEIICTIIILGLMFLTAVILFYNSANAIIENIQGAFLPIYSPVVVIVIEAIAIVSMYILSLYQRIVGNRNQSLALISQSIDSKNSVYSSAAVIIGVIFSIYGIHWVDAIVGAFIAVKISTDGVSLTREIRRSMKGEQPEFSKFKLPIEKRFEQFRLDNIRNWILYTLHTSKSRTKQGLVDSLEKTFRPSYFPAAFNEFRLGTDIDLEEDFSDLIKPLVDDAYIVEAKGAYLLTSKGKMFIKDTVDTLRYKETEL